MGHLSLIVLLVGCGAGPAAAGGARRQVAFTGSGESAPFRLQSGIYQAERRNLPDGCLRSAGLFDAHGVAVIDLERAIPSSPHGGWSGLSIDVIPGRYQVRGAADPTCRWSFRLTFRGPIPSGTSR